MNIFILRILMLDYKKMEITFANFTSLFFLMTGKLGKFVISPFVPNIT